MLQLDKETLNIEGVTIYRDHALENQFWYHEGPVSLARRNDKPQFTLVTYRGDAADGGVDGGGFLMLESQLKLDEITKRRILSKLSGISDDEPRLAPIQYDEGSVQIVALDLQGGGGTTAEPPPPGSFVAVEKILGATTPSLAGDNNAVFGLQLSKEGTQIMEAAFKQGGMPVGVIYNLKYTALRPSIQAKVEANYKRIYDHLSMGIDLTAGADISGVPVYLNAGIDMAFEKLRQEQAVKITIINFSTDDDRADKEEYVLNLFKEMLLADWFEPSLDPIEFDDNGGGGGDDDGGTVAPPPPSAELGSAASSIHSGAELVAQPRDTSPAGDMGVKLAFKMKIIKQQEDKFATIEYDRTDAVQRMYGPQGLIGLLAGDLDDAHFLKVDLDGVFFRKLDIVVDAPVDFERLGVMAVDVAVQYGSADDADHIRREDFRFDKDNRDRGEVSFFINRSLDLHYMTTTQYHFDPLSGWVGEKMTYNLPTRKTFDRTLLVNPFNELGFVEIKIIPGDVDAELIESSDVHLSYDDGDWATDTVINVKPDSPEQFWKLRLSKPDVRQFSYRFVHHLKNGDTKEAGPVTQNATTVVVNDPFEDPLIVEFLPNYDGSSIRQLFVTVNYDDEPNEYNREQRLVFVGSEFEPKTVRLARMNTDLREFSFTIMILGTDNSVRRMPPVRSLESLVFLGEHI